MIVSHYHYITAWPPTRLRVAADRSDRALNQREWLTRFLDDGRIVIDSNTIERSMRPIALNRKNALFGGHDLGGGNWTEQGLTAEAWPIYTTQPQEGFLPWNSSNLLSQGRLNRLSIGQVSGLLSTGIKTMSLQPVPNLIYPIIPLVDGGRANQIDLDMPLEATGRFIHYYTEVPVSQDWLHTRSAVGLAALKGVV